MEDLFFTRRKILKGIGVTVGAAAAGVGLSDVVRFAEASEKKGGGKIEARLKELGIELPPVAKPVAAYVPAVKTDQWVYCAGQIPFVKGKLAYAGVVGKDLSLEDGYKAAHICCINLLAALKSVIGSLDKVEQIVKVTGFVASAPDFTLQHKCVNGASELLGKVFGDAGKHARCALGVNVLPLNAPIEVDLVAMVKA